MNVYWLIALALGISIASFLFGNPPTGIELWSQYSAGHIDFSTFMNGMLTGIAQWQNALGLVAVVGIALLSGFNLITLVPLALLYMLFSMFIIPQSFFTGMGLPEPFNTLILLFFNVAYIVAATAFIRNG